MKPVYRYKRSYRRFTWQNRIAHGAAVLSVRRHTPKDECSYYAVIAVIESLLRLYRGFTENLSIRYLKQKHDKVIKFSVEMKKLGRVERLLNMLMDIGVPSDELYNLALQGARVHCPLHKIGGYKRYAVSCPMQIRRALEVHLKAGPMVGVFYISANYSECMKLGIIYRFNGTHEQNGNKTISHAVCIVSFGVEETVPFLLFRTDNMRWPEYGRVEMQSVIELYGINM